MLLRPKMLCVVLIAAVVASGCAAQRPEEIQPPAVQAYEVVDGSRPHRCRAGQVDVRWLPVSRPGSLAISTRRRKVVTQVPLGQGSAPHGVIVGPAGPGWVHRRVNVIVRVDSTTHEVPSSPLPTNRMGANLNTATFDRPGALWFTGLAGCMVKLTQDRQHESL